MRAKPTKTWKPKKHTHKYKDFRQLVVYCISEFGDETPEKAAYRITDEDWVHPDSDHKESKAILKAVRAAWAGAKKDSVEVGKEDEQKRLSEPEKLAKAVEYVKMNVVYDTLKNTYLDTTTLRETSPSDVYINYNDLVSDKLYIQRYFFETAFESVQVPKHDTVKLWSEALPKWDKVDHIKKLCTFIPAKDSRQLELFLKTWLIRAYIQTVNPHNKPAIEVVNRHFLILQSNLESNGKSSFLSWLCPDLKWVKVCGIEQGKDGKRALAEYMFILDDEMHGIKQFKETDAFKSLISTSKIDVRLPYAKKDSELSRIASFCGSCNSPKIFSVGEQNTRFLCVPLQDKMFDYRGYMKYVNKQKLWGQVKAMAETKWLEENAAEVRKLRSLINEDFERETFEQHIIETYIRPNPARSQIMRTSDILLTAKQLDGYQNTNLNITLMGAILTKVYGPPIKGYVGDTRTQGYPVMWVSPDPKLSAVSAVRSKKKGVFKKPQR